NSAKGPTPQPLQSERLRFLQLDEWDEHNTYDEEVPTCLSRFVPDTWPATSSHQQPPPVHVHILRRYHLALLSSLCNNTNTFSFILRPLQFVAPSIHLQDILPHPKSSRHQFFKPSRNQLPEPHAQ